MPLHRRLPKRGFNNIFKKVYAIVTLDHSQYVLKTVTVVDKNALLVDAGIIKQG